MECGDKVQRGGLPNATQLVNWAGMQKEAVCCQAYTPSGNEGRR